MALPFDQPCGRLPVIVPAPSVRPETLADGTSFYVPYGIVYLELKRDRGLFEIDFMLIVRQFAALSAAERFTILALARRLMFSDKLEFPGLHDTGKLHFVDGGDEKLVWATIPSHVIVTSSFTALDLHDECMALDEPAALREAIEQAIQGCPGADVDALFERFGKFKTPHRTDISRALTQLPRLGIVREYIPVGRHRRRAVMNMRMIAATRSGILRGMIAAEDHLRRYFGTTVAYSVDIDTAAPPAERINATLSGKRRRITRYQYQALHNAERGKRIAAERRAAALAEDHARNGLLTPEQHAGLQRVLGARDLPDCLRSELERLFNTARPDHEGTRRFTDDAERP